MSLLAELFNGFLQSLRDVFPIALIIFGFQVFLLRRPIPNLPKVLLGFLYVLLGITLFLRGLELALFPLGTLMAEQLTQTNFLYNSQPVPETRHWSDYAWVYLFGSSVGFASAIAEPSLLAVAMKASEVSGGIIRVWGLRVAVACGVAIGLALGTFRIVSGIPIPYFLLPAYVLVLIQTAYAPRMVIPLAYDSGGVTTSTVTVPLVAALGLGLATHVPGRNPLVDGFGLIAFACLFPIMSVMGYAQLAHWRAQRNKGRG